MNIPALNDVYVVNYLLSVSNVKILFRYRQVIYYFVKSQNFHLDSVYKLIDLCHPIFVLRITDFEGDFIPIALVVCTHENFDKYKEIDGNQFIKALHYTQTIISDLASQLTALAKFFLIITNKLITEHVSRNI